VGRRPLFSLGLILLAGCGAAWKPVPTPTPHATKTRPAQTFITRDGVHFVPGKLDERPDLVEIQWSEIRFADGRLTLGGLSGRARMYAYGDCVRYRSVEIGPLDGDFRRVAVRAEVLPDPCRPPADRIVLEPEGWTRATIAAPGELHVPDRRLTDSPREDGGGGVLQPDGRTIVVGFDYESCGELVEGVARASAALYRGVALVSVRMGTDPTARGDFTCGGEEHQGYTIARLPEEVPPGTDVQWIPCGNSRRPPC
jgi:hypothetical protein